MFYLLTLLLPLCAEGAESSPRYLEIAPSHQSFFYTTSPAEEGGCTAALHEPTKVEIVSETDTHFEVKWLKPLSGCYYHRLFKGLSMEKGFVRKDDLIWRADGDEELPILASVNTPRSESAAPPKVECEENVTATDAGAPAPATAVKAPSGPLGELGNIGSLIKVLRREQAGMKRPEDIDKYMECYPYGDEGLANYRRYKRFISMAGDHFRLEVKGAPIEVHPTLMACLFRRESGFDPKNSSHTEAVGLGQHTSINIKDMSQRLKRKGSWEAALWNGFFERVKKDPEGRRMLAECKGTGKAGEPAFNSKDDARCPLQSMAASAIYNLLIQRELTKSAKAQHIEWEQELEFQLAVGAAYNLGNGAASQAVQNLFVGGWLNSILRKSPSKDKKQEVASHIAALKNCMSSGNWEPMMPKDKPVCEGFPGRDLSGSGKPAKRR